MNDSETALAHGMVVDMLNTAPCDSQNDRGPAIIVAGGGSGGHISPGLAIVERLLERWAASSQTTAPSDSDPGPAPPRAPEPDHASGNGNGNGNGNGAGDHHNGGARRAVFVCSRRPIDTRMLSSAGARYVPIPAVPPSRDPLKALKFLRAFRTSRQVCRRIMHDDDVRHVLALGGFVSAPAVAAARSRGIPVTLLNLDDPPGRANRWLARGCDRVWTATELPSLRGFAQRVVGMPIRRRALAPAEPPECRRELGLDPDLPTLLITGASQGSSSINQFMVALADADPDLFRGWQIYHLAGYGSVSAIRSAYARRNIRARVETFLDDIGLAWGAADAAVSRSGANSVAEVAANALPTLFMPYPYHHDMHQRNNAQPLVDAGGAVMEDDLIDPRANVERAGQALRRLLRDGPHRAAMRAALLENKPPDAAELIADLLLERHETNGHE